MKVIELIIVSALFLIALMWVVFGVVTVFGVDTGLDVDGPEGWFMVALGMLFGTAMGISARNKWRDIRASRQEGSDTSDA